MNLQSLTACALACVLVSLGGCAATPSTDPAASPGMNCEKEAPIGSNILVNRCRSTEQARREREGAQDALRRTASGATPGERPK